MSRESAIVLLVDAVEDKVDEVEAREKGGWQINVLWDREIWVIFASNGIGRGKDARSCIQGGDDAGFGYGYGLLFHYFVQHRSCRIGHFVEFVYTADSTVGQH